MDTIEAVNCFETGVPLVERHTIYAATLPGVHRAVALSLEALLQIPADEHNYDEMSLDAEHGLNIHVTMDMAGSKSVQVDDFKICLAPETVCRYLPETANAFGLVPATST